MSWTVPLWALAFGAGIMFIAGFIMCAIFVAGGLEDQGTEHARLADALLAKQSRIDRALECVTENSAHVGKKMAAILKEER